MNKKIYKTKWFSWCLVVIWMGVIFLFSHQTASESSELSSGFMTIILNMISFISPAEISMDFFHLYIRKLAHFTVYFILGVFIIHALFSQGHWKRDSTFALIISIVYAISDEVHQLFIPGRSGEVKDVLIDSSGAFVGIILYVLIRFILSRKSR